MGAFLTSFRQAFRRTDTSRTGAESLAAVDQPHTATRLQLPADPTQLATGEDELAPQITQAEHFARPDTADLTDDDADGYPA
jgi:hypothetical protein